MRDFYAEHTGLTPAQIVNIGIKRRKLDEGYLLRAIEDTYREFERGSKRKGLAVLHRVFHRASMLQGVESAEGGYEG